MTDQRSLGPPRAGQVATRALASFGGLPVTVGPALIDLRAHGARRGQTVAAVVTSRHCLMVRVGTP